MGNGYYEVEASTLFSESLIWQLNRDYYKEIGIDAWSSGIVPHHMTSNAMVGKTYAELILAFLKDLAAKGQTKETVYMLELGAGHGRLAFHILKHLEKIQPLITEDLPPFCYVISDIIEENLNFFQTHTQFQSYFEKGVLEVAYFDAVATKELYLRHSKKTVLPNSLHQPILALANYFFDSIPSDLFLIQNKGISACSVELQSPTNPAEMDVATLIDTVEVSFHKKLLDKPFYKDVSSNDLLESYKELLVNTHLFFPKKSLDCIANLQNLSTKGLMVITMDKGYHEVHDLEKKGEPDIIIHGSFSLWVNYHALGAFCEKQGGKVLFPAFSSFYLEMGCLMFLPDAEKYEETNAAYQRCVNDFGPDDFNSIKKLTYQNIARLTIVELIAFLRLSAYDSGLFHTLLPRLKQVVKRITFNERRRFAQTMHQTWEMYFNIDEPFDLAYEMGGIFYDLGFYKEALTYFKYSTTKYGEKADIYYNRILCHYQLREDALFMATLKEAKVVFPNFEKFTQLDKLDLGAA